jgi:hypothetical protein
MESKTVSGLAIALALAMIGAALLATWLIGAERLRVMGMILISGVTVAAVLAASALPIRAYRKKDMTGETRILDGTRTIVKEVRIIDGRPAPQAPEVKLLQLPAAPNGAAFPELLRAAWQAGQLGQSTPAPRQLTADDADVIDSDDPNLWGGSVRP